MFDGEVLSSSSSFTAGGPTERAKRFVGVATCTFLISFARTCWHCRISRSLVLDLRFSLVFHHCPGGSEFRLLSVCYWQVW